MLTCVSTAPFLRVTVPLSCMSFVGERVFDHWDLAIGTVVGRNVVLILRGNDGLFVDDDGRMPHDNLALAERFGYNW